MRFRLDGRPGATHLGRMSPDNIVRLRPTRPCPICGRPSAQAFHPFCSQRCADVDLNRWLSGSYVIPADADSEPEAMPGEDDEV